MNSANFAVLFVTLVLFILCYRPSIICCSHGG